MENSRISVVIPAYNAARFIGETLDSVLAQTYKDFEILVVDDGSTDETRKIVEEYGDKVKYFHKENGGVSKARNYGIERAEGKYVAFLDADDLWLPEKLAEQVKLLEANENIGLCYAAAEKVDENLRHIGYIEAKTFDDYCEALLLNLNIVAGSCSSAIVRRDVILQTSGFDPQFSTCADWEYWLRLSLLTEFAPVTDYLVKYRVLAGSMSSNPFVSKKDTFNTLDKFFSLPNVPEKYKNLRNRAFSNNLMVVSGEFLHNGKWTESLKCMWESFRLYPSNIKRPLGLPLRFVKRLFSN